MTVAIAVYQSVASVKVNGTYYLNGNATVLQSGIAVPVSANVVGGGYSFGYWESYVGNFSNFKSPSTTFTPFSVTTVGTLAMILNDTGLSGEFWSGYIANRAVPYVSCVGGTYYNVPPTTYVGGGYPTTDVNSIWVGIGGVEGTDYLWQAGILVTYTGAIGGGGNQLYWQPFTEAATGAPNQGPTWTGPSSTSFPSELIISVCTAPRGQDTAEIEAYYASTHIGIWWNETTSGFTPDTNTAEWIVEDPTVSGGSRAPLGAFAPFGVIYPSWTDDGVTHSRFLGPLTYLSLTDTSYGTQYVAPGTITGGLGQYPITYST